MRELGWLLVIVALALGVAYLSVYFADSYVLFSVGEWAVEVGLLALLLGLVVLYLLGWLLWKLVATPVQTLRDYLDHRAEAQLRLGMAALAEGRYKKAEKALTKSARNERTRTVSYLAAAQAAAGEGAEDRADKYLEQAEAHDATHDSVVLTRAQLKLSGGDADEALEILDREFAGRAKRRPRVLELYAGCYERLGRWVELGALAPDLVAAGVLETEEAEEIERRALREKLLAADTVEQAQAVWTSVPRARRKHAAIVAEYAARLLALDQPDKAEPLLREALNREWDESLMMLYAQLKGGDVSRRIQATEGWAPQHADSAALHLALGRSCLERELWGKAREHISQAIALSGDPDAYIAMGDLEAALDEPGAAMRAYEQACSLLRG